jgi:hypothetical protein
MEGEKYRKDNIRNWFLLFLLIVLIAAGSQYILGQEKDKEDKQNDKKTCLAEECHSKPLQVKTGEEKMEEEKKYSEEECHKKFAAELFNLVWSLLEKKDRTKGEDEKMINAAYASLYHWSVVGKAINFQRGHWMISRVYSVLGRPEPALYHAKECMQLTQQHGFVDFDLAFAYEAMARAYAVNRKRTECQKYVKLAIEAGEKIKSEGDRKYFFSDFEKYPWYGMK